jgi:hypothetical protein
MNTPEFIAGWRAGMLAAAAEVETHWNDWETMTNQKQQALRSGAVLRNMAVGEPPADQQPERNMQP